MSNADHNHSSDIEHIHFRRCHICGVINERAQSLVDRCGHCHKFLAPFVFFDEQVALGIPDDRPEGVRKEEPSKKVSTIKISRAATQNNYPPIWGLTVYW